jgi:hypothetical protein
VSPRALAYLATLPRREALGKDALAEALGRAGCPVHDAWIDFHARFAGYEETIGRDWAIWGIVHAAPCWLSPHEALVNEPDSGDPRLSVMCADVHGAYGYSLYTNGEFYANGGGGRCETFDKKLERDSLVWEARAGERPWRWMAFDDAIPKSSLAPLREWLRAEPVPEASDRFVACWRSRDVIVFERDERDRSSACVATDAYDRVTAFLHEVRAPR